MSFYRGKKAEEEFFELAKERGFKIERSSKKENINDHIDFFLTFQGVKESFDIKARKKINRSDIDYCDKILWIELKNVRGNNGWLYGCADKIVFERSDDFILVNRLDLVNFVKKNVDFSRILCKKEKNKIYSRKGREDQLTFIDTQAILDNYNVEIWQKKV